MCSARHAFRVLSCEIMAELRTSASKKEGDDKFKDRSGMSYVTVASWVEVDEKTEAPLLAPP
jgi:hypothetical protein